MFSMFLPSLLCSRHALLSHYKRWSNKLSNLKIQQWFSELDRFCSHCLYFRVVSYHWHRTSALHDCGLRN